MSTGLIVTVCRSTGRYSVERAPFPDSSSLFSSLPLAVKKFEDELNERRFFGLRKREEKKEGGEREERGGEERGGGEREKRGDSLIWSVVSVQMELVSKVLSSFVSSLGLIIVNCLPFSSIFLFLFLFLISSFFFLSLFLFLLS